MPKTAFRGGSLLRLVLEMQVGRWQTGLTPDRMVPEFERPRLALRLVHVSPQFIHFLALRTAVAPRQNLSVRPDWKRGYFDFV